MNFTRMHYNAMHSYTHTQTNVDASGWWAPRALVLVRSWYGTCSWPWQPWSWRDVNCNGTESKCSQQLLVRSVVGTDYTVKLLNNNASFLKRIIACLIKVILINKIRCLQECRSGSVQLEGGSNPIRLRISCRALFLLRMCLYPVPCSFS